MPHIIIVLACFKDDTPNSPHVRTSLQLQGARLVGLGVECHPPGNSQINCPQTLATHDQQQLLGVGNQVALDLCPSSISLC